MREQVEGVAVSGVFSPVLSDQEYRVEELVREVLGDLPVSLSHEIGSLLYAIMGMGQFNEGVGESQREDVSAALQSAASLQLLLTDLRDSQRAGSGPRPAPHGKPCFRIALGAENSAGLNSSLCSGPSGNR